MAKKAAAPQKAAPVKKAPVKKAPVKKNKITLHKRLATLFQARPKNFALGNDLPPKRDLTHYVKWPKYVRLQRQRKILSKRLKTPPPVHAFDHILPKTNAVALFKFLAKYRPEEDAARKARRVAAAKKVAEVMKAKKEAPVAERKAAYKNIVGGLAAKRPMAVKFGLNHVTNLICKGKAKLVVIACDVDPIELVIWLPQLCRKKNVPFCIVKNKARLGQLCHRKTASCLAVTAVKKADREEFNKLVQEVKPHFLENFDLLRRWGEPRLGLKHNAIEAKRRSRLAKIEASKK